MPFFIVTIKIIQLEVPAQKRWFKSEIPAIPRQEWWFHTKVSHPNPTSLVRARPDILNVSGMRLPTHNGSWIYQEDGTWVFMCCPQFKEDAKNWIDILETQWSKGRKG